MSENVQVEKVEVLNEIEASKYIGMSRSFLSQDRMNGTRRNRTKGPTYIKIGRSIRYLMTDLNAWLDANRIQR